MTTIQIDAGTLTASLEERTVTGLLVPYGEPGATNLGKMTVLAGALKVPVDLGGMSLNIEHDRTQIVGHPTSIRETPAGIVGTFRIAATPEGDRALQDVASGKRRYLSVEASDLKIRNGQAVDGRLFAAALVERPAFPSATLLASIVDTLLAEEVSTTTNEEEYVDENGVTWRRVTDSSVDVATSPEGATTTITTTVVEETQTPADLPVDPIQEEAPVGNVPSNTLTAASAAATSTQPTLGRVLSIIDGVRSGSLEGDTLLAALSDIKISGSGALPATGVLQPNWLGELWGGRRYTRRYMPLISNGTIRALDEKGFRLSPDAELVQTWAGNKAEIGSGGASTELVTSTLAKWAWAADIAREFFDLPGGEEVIAAMLRAVADSYARVTDLWTLSQLVTSGAANLTAAATYPTDYPSALGQLIQGITAVEDAGDTPSFAIVNATAWSELIYTPKDQVPEFINISVSTTGEGVADGRVRVVKGDIGISGTAASLVGSAAAAHVNEMAGASPLQLDALDIAKGGVDRAVVGYTQYMNDYTNGLVLVGTAPARANSTAYTVGSLILASSVLYRVTVAGTSHTSAPTAPAVGATVADGTATLLRIS